MRAVRDVPEWNTQGGKLASVGGLTVVMVMVLCLSGCHRVYVLPDGTSVAAEERALPVEAEESGTPPEEVDSDRRDIARQVIESLRGAMGEEDWPAFWELLSHETRLVMDHHHPRGGDAALAEGKLVVDGRDIVFRPARVFLVEDQISWRLLSREESEAASDRRIEVELTGRSEERRVVLIREGMVWRLHSPSIERGRLGGGDGEP